MKKKTKIKAIKKIFKSYCKAKKINADIEYNTIAEKFFITWNVVFLTLDSDGTMHWEKESKGQTSYGWKSINDVMKWVISQFDISDPID